MENKLILGMDEAKLLTVNTVIFHHPCSDGMMSAAIAYRWYSNQYYEDPADKGKPKKWVENVVFKGCGYNDKFLPDVKDRVVLVFDFSFENKKLMQLLKTAKEILVVDHHDTAEKAWMGLQHFCNPKKWLVRCALEGQSNIHIPTDQREHFRAYLTEVKNILSGFYEGDEPNSKRLAMAINAITRLESTVTMLPTEAVYIPIPKDFAVTLSFIKQAYNDVSSVVTSKLKCHFDMNHSGAYLAWKVFYPNEPKVPEVVRYVEDRDLWKWELPNSRELSTAMFISIPLSVDEYGLLIDEEEKLKPLMQSGIEMLDYQKRVIESAMHLVEVRLIRGKKAGVINTPFFPSEFGENILKNFPEVDMAMIWNRDESRYKKAFKPHLRSRKDSGVNVGDIAKLFGGGGHPNASSFEWTKDSMESLYDDDMEPIEELDEYDGSNPKRRLKAQCIIDTPAPSNDSEREFVAKQIKGKVEYSQACELFGKRTRVVNTSVFVYECTDALLKLSGCEQAIVWFLGYDGYYICITTKDSSQSNWLHLAEPYTSIDNFLEGKIHMFKEDVIEDPSHIELDGNYVPPDEGQEDVSMDEYESSSIDDSSEMEELLKDAGKLQRTCIN